MVPSNLVWFIGGTQGSWRIERLTTVAGSPLPPAARLEISHAALPISDRVWALNGVISNDRYTERRERELLEAMQPPLNRPHTNHAALIPIRKTQDWWNLAQDERRAILETRSHHIITGLGFLPAIARRLHHSRDLGGEFDFLTWFEYATRDARAFEDLVGTLRETEEWTYVEREIDIRLVKEPPS